MKNIDDHKKYVLETRRHFSNIVREIIGNEPSSFIISDKYEIHDFLYRLSSKVNLDKKKMSYIWWWRGGGNSHLQRFELLEDYLLINGWKVKVKEIYINVSPISIFDFIVFRIVGDENDNPDTKNYDWNNGNNALDLSRHDLLDYSIREYSDDIVSFKQPYNFILTAQFGLTNLEVYSDNDIGRMLNRVLFNEIDYEHFNAWYTRILRNMKREVERFYEHLIKYPMLGLEHPLGKHINGNLKKSGRYNLVDKTFFRARELKNNEAYNEDEMWHPPANEVAVYEGRYNHFGQSFLYLADDENTAFKEVIPEWHRSCSMIQFTVQKEINVLDLRRVNFYADEGSIEYIMLHYMLVHEGTISQETNDRYVKPEYLVSRFLADCARANNFEGILFDSTKFSGDNLVLFYPDQLKSEGKIVTKQCPYLFTLV